MAFLEVLSQIDKVIDPVLLEQSLETALENVMFDMQQDFEATTDSWTNQPEFYSVGPRDKGDGLEGAVGTDDDIYMYVSRGTAPHSIEPRNASVLRFMSGSTPKTQPGFLGSGEGGQSGEWVVAKHVDHPGTQARGYEDLIADKYGPILAAEVQKRIDRNTGS